MIQRCSCYIYLNHLPRPQNLDGLPNGHAELLTLLSSSTVQDVRTKAQQAFGKKHTQTYHCQSCPSRFEQTLGP